LVSQDTYTLRQPIGVCAGITPFNFPAMIPLWMFPMAIVTGNTFVLKPSEQYPLSTMMLVELGLEADIPAGVLNVVHGGKEVVDFLDLLLCRPPSRRNHNVERRPTPFPTRQDQSKPTRPRSRNLEADALG
jgi:hypothetical protein